MNSRRKFLKSLAGAATALSMNVFSNVSILGNRYTNSRLGLSVDKPAGWEFSSIADFAQLRDRQTLLDAMEFIEEDEVHPLKDPENLPVFLFEDPLNRDGYFVPTIVLYNEYVPEGAPEDLTEGHDLMLKGFSYSYRNLTVLAEPAWVTAETFKGTTSTWSYRHELDTGEEFDLQVKTLVTLTNGRAHTFYMVDDLCNPRIPIDAWGEFLDSIRYDKAASFE